MKREKNPCLDCGCYDPDMGCMMPSVDKCYACPLEADPDETYTNPEEYKELYDNITSLPNCNSCGIKGLCKFCVAPGQVSRFNCPLWVEPKKERSKEL
ncbi:MAG: hypothetical protein IJY82_01930 [Oscillospiraceae bacterium]|nr:hypothetical protein [Oscillospiraceae bacterium]